MRIFAYCCHSFRHSVRRAAGVEPITSPPFSIFDLDPTELEDHDLLYFKLHGLPGQPYWYGDNWMTAVSAEQISELNLLNTTVFVANCHLYQPAVDDVGIRYSHMLQALLNAGARAVVGGPGINFAARRRVFGADLLGMVFRQVLKANRSAEEALALAKTRLRQGRQDRVTRDTLEFRLFT